MNIKAIVVAGPTAVGKTEYSIEVARNFEGEIVSCDSMQLYKFMNIGSAKPTPRELEMAPHHLVDIIDPREEFSVAKYQKLALSAIEDIHSRGKMPIISGGTGLYLNSLLYEMDFGGSTKDSAFRRRMEEIALTDGPDRLYQMLSERDPDAAKRLHPNNVKRVIRALEAVEQGKSISSFECVTRERPGLDAEMIALERDREELYERINLRVDKLIDMGLIEEVKGLMDMGLKASDISMKGIGYKEIIEHLDGDISLEEAVDKVKKNTRHYAKRQMTWLRRYDNIKWFNLSNYSSESEAKEDIIAWLKERS